MATARCAFKKQPAAVTIEKQNVSLLKHTTCALLMASYTETCSVCCNKEKKKGEH
jgi:hypothetical protein